MTPPLTRSLGALVVGLPLAVGACADTDEGVRAAPATTAVREVVYRDMTAYEFSVCWRDVDGTVRYPTTGAVPGPGAEIGNVRLYVPFDETGIRLTDVDTFTRCSVEA